MKRVILYMVKDENGREYGYFFSADDVEDFRMYLFMEKGLDSIYWSFMD